VYKLRSSLSKTRRREGRTVDPMLISHLKVSGRRGAATKRGKWCEVVPRCFPGEISKNRNSLSVQVLGDHSRGAGMANSRAFLSDYNIQTTKDSISTDVNTSKRTLLSLIIVLLLCLVKHLRNAGEKTYLCSLEIPLNPNPLHN